MLTKITIRNFKCFDEVAVDLASPVVFIGPNNSGKTTALQALALWEIGIKHWNSKRKGKTNPEKRPGVTINRRDLVAVPVPSAKLLWSSLHVRDTRRVKGKQETQNIRIDIIVEGITPNSRWTCGLEFDYANEESFYCRPLRLSTAKDPNRMPVPVEAGNINIAFLPPMSGLAANETRLDEGAVKVRVGEGRTAEVLRNLCFKIFQEKKECWDKLANRIKSFFGVTIEEPELIVERGEIEMNYREKGSLLDISCSGRGLQQTLLLLSYMYANPGSVLLLDEPDAHLEILRQRQMYRFLTEEARENNNQIIAASHSEVLLNEAAERDTVVAFVGKPHRIGDRGSQVMKSLKEIGFEHYYQAEQKGWVLYLEGSTDLAVLQNFAEILQYEEAIKILERPFVHYTRNEPSKAKSHFYGLREAVPHLKGAALFDRLGSELPGDLNLTFLMWRKCEIENYLCFRETLEQYALKEGWESGETDHAGPLFIKLTAKTMEECINDIEKAMEVLGKGSPWDADTKVSDDFLFPLFKKYFETLGLPNTMTKKNFHRLARFVPKDKIDPEVKEKLDAIVQVAKSAKPAQEE
ncbi:MAG: AAA family ATPase [Candidatus Aminicenantes bacterium]|jgi:predicted ATPase